MAEMLIFFEHIKNEMWGCDKESKVFVTGASLAQATVAPLVLVAASYTALARILINVIEPSSLISYFKLSIHSTICGQINKKGDNLIQTYFTINFDRIN